MRTETLFSKLKNLLVSHFDHAYCDCQCLGHRLLVWLLIGIGKCSLAFERTQYVIRNIPVY